MAGITLGRISKSFGSVEVISDLSLEIGSGEFVVLLGPSGCGKTTVLRMIAGLEDLTEGEILIDGQRVDQLAPGKRGVAMVFQHYALYPHMSVRDNMAFGLKNIGADADDITQKIDEAARILEIGHLLDRKPTQLSGGQKQRVAIGRAIVKQPKAFLFDEPLSNLDAALRSRTRIELARLHQQIKSTMVFVTHDQVEAMTMATRIVVMNKGRIEQIGAPMDIYRKPASRFVATFVGTPAMNLIPVAVVGENNGCAVVTLPNGSRINTGVRVAELPKDSINELGVRAEHVTMGADVPAVVSVVERLGDRTFVYAEMADRTALTFEVSGDSPIAIGDRVNLLLKPQGIHLFARDGSAYHAQ
ncbi:MAG: sn-glycerol-3-phosphate ABC transporter ATP-binding protein UgpC [Hyphomicrobiales bacterium]|nr:sn-glycerol-3-phosphate ABC transporter ATP-binding protein UgpC [Hyphomicrobiales bacterium]